MNIIEFAEMHLGWILGFIAKENESIFLSFLFVSLVVAALLSIATLLADGSKELIETQTSTIGLWFSVNFSVVVFFSSLLFIPFFIGGMVERGTQTAEASVLFDEFPPGYIEKYCYKGLLDYRKIMDRSITEETEVEKIIYTA